MSLDNLVKVVVPIYKTTLSKKEKISLDQCCKVLERYTLVFFVPENLDMDTICQNYPQFQIERFDDNYFKSQSAYNRLVLSKEFYQRFDSSQYILIYQLDAFVFKDELELWCNKGYDYVGAPWLSRKESPYLITRLLRHIRITKRGLKNKFNSVKQISTKSGRVGNGGFSLRKIATLSEVLENDTKLKTHLALEDQGAVMYQEDIYWASQLNLKIPDVKEALLFAFDSYPKIAFHLSKQLPFGCHGWILKKKYSFWKKYIPIN